MWFFNNFFFFKVIFIYLHCRGLSTFFLNEEVAKDIEIIMFLLLIVLKKKVKKNHWRSHVNVFVYVYVKLKNR